MPTNRLLDRSHFMSETKARRGRPKGTGIDDRARLRSIAALMFAEPGLKPTTAIKRIGITDPSIIRRLRDKFHACHLELMAELRTNATPAPVPAQPALRPAPERDMVAAQVMARTAALLEADAARFAVRPNSLPVAESGTSNAASPVSSPRYGGSAEAEVDEWIASVCGLGLQAAAQALETQLMLLAQFVRLPQFALAARQQVAFNDYAMALSDAALRSRHH